MQFTKATNKDIGELIALWKLCFPEDAKEDVFLRDFFDTFFQRTEHPAEIVIAKETQPSDQILAMAVLIPVTLLCSGREHPIYYLYAMGTHPSLRGRGIGIGLLRFADETALENGKDGIALLPAESGLTEFYRKAGYEPCFTDDPELPDRILYPPYYLAFENRYEWDGAPEDVSGMFRPLRCKIKGLADMAYPLS